MLTSKLKNLLERKRLHNVDEMEGNVSKKMLIIKKAEYEKCFLKYEDCWKKVVMTRGELLEKDIKLIVIQSRGNSNTIINSTSFTTGAYKFRCRWDSNPGHSR